jgi:hypothetical protein
MRFLLAQQSSSCQRIAVRKNGVASLAYVAGIHVFAGVRQAEDVDGWNESAMTVAGARRHVHFSRSAVLSRSRTAPELSNDQGKT